jgi:cytochrome c biogenesis protein CcmG, thiol:disulfide interchange protein DsbE
MSGPAALTRETMRRQRAAIRGLAVVFAVALAAGAARRAVSQAPSETPSQTAIPAPLAVGEPAPGAPVRTVGGAHTDLGVYLGARPVVMEFWGRWCPNCRALEPKLEAARRAYGSRVAFVTVAVSVDETPAEVAAYAKAHGFLSGVVYDETGAAVDAYGAPGTSYVVIIDRSRRIVYTGAGADQDIVAAIKRAM